MTEYKRPNIPYAGEALPNNTRYELLTQNRQPPTPVLMDSEMNYVIDSLNDLDHKIKDVEAGAIPGSSETINKDKLLKTDGEGNLSWILAGEAQLALASVGTDQVKDGAITTPKIGNASITTDKIYDQNVTRIKIQDGAVDNSKIADSSIDGEKKIKGGSIPANKIKANQPNSYGVMGFHDGIGHSISGTTAPGYYLRTEGVSGLTRYGRIKTADLDAGIVGDMQLAANAVTAPKIKDGAVTNSKVPQYTFTYDRMIKNPRKARGAVITTPDGTMNIAAPADNLGGSFLKSKKDDAPQFEKLGPADLPNIGMQPVYMANFNADGTLVNSYNPFNFVISFSWVGPNYYLYQIILKDTDDASKFVAVGGPLTDSPYVMNFKIVLKTGIYVRFRFSQQVGDSVSTVQSAGSIILYKIA